MATEEAREGKPLSRTTGICDLAVIAKRKVLPVTGSGKVNNSLLRVYQ
jgi:hypothetical protein